jgi:hypothetical protein
MADATAGTIKAPGYVAGMDQVVLFGAGASYGCGQAVPSQPPLGPGLYPALRQLYPEIWGALPRDLDETFIADFEAGMLALVAADGHAVAPLMRAMTHYFATFGLDSSKRDLYSDLLRGLAPGQLKRTLFSTLNYECLLEIAAAGQHLGIHYDQEPLSSNSIRIWKLHGSCNFIPAGLTMRSGVSFAFKGVSFDGPLQFVQPDAARNWAAGDNALYAAMCLYTVDKPTQIGASFINQLQSAWADVVLDAKRIVVIGTRPHDQDRHLWEPLAETAADVHYVGALGDFEAWVERSGRQAARTHLLSELFSDALPAVIDLLN